MTTVGYGDMLPGTPSEQLLIMLQMLIACGIFAYIVGAISSILNDSDSIVGVLKEQARHVNTFLMMKGIPRDLRSKVRSYLEYLEENKRKFKLDE